MCGNSNKEGALKLTLAVYKVTALFPAGDDLGLKIRELADKVSANLLLGRTEGVTQFIGELMGALNLAEEKHWVDARNFLVLRREYDKIRQPLEAAKNSGKTMEPPFLVNNGHNGNGNGNNHRHDKIIEAINGNGKVKIGELLSLFPGLNRRTVLRDLDKLCQSGVMVRNGNGRGAHYTKNGLNHDMS